MVIGLVSQLFPCRFDPSGRVTSISCLGWTGRWPIRRQKTVRIRMRLTLHPVIILSFQLLEKFDSVIEERRGWVKLAYDENDVS